MSFKLSPIESRVTLFVPVKKKHCYSLLEGGSKDEFFLSKKGANLCEIKRLGYDVPPTYIVSSDNSLEYYKVNSLSKDFLNELHSIIASLEITTGNKFGAIDTCNPLLLCVRCGSLINTSPIVTVVDPSIDAVNTNIFDIVGG